MKIIFGLFLFGFGLAQQNTGRNRKDVQFYLYNPIYRSGERIRMNDAASAAALQNDFPVRIIIHGWLANYQSEAIVKIKDAYISKGNFNVIVVNWEKANNIGYLAVLEYLEKTGRNIAKLIEFISDSANISYDEIYIIGHSLGAHIAGIAGRNLHPDKVDTIFGLDPARFIFNNDDVLKSNDANYVEVIHTSTASLGLGAIGKMGISDFYPNLGWGHPHCEANWTLGCDHMAAAEFFAESINSQIGFNANQCYYDNHITESSCNVGKGTMGGEPSAKNGEHSYYLVTNANKPYAVETNANKLYMVKDSRNVKWY